LTARWWSRLTTFLTLAAFSRLIAPTVADPDLWGHIRFGQRTLSLGLEREDPFSYLSAGHAWINHEILSEATFGLLFDTGGATALIILKTCVALLTVVLIYRHLLRRGADAVRASLLLLPAGFLMIPGFATVRPQMFTYLFFALAVLTLHKAETSSEKWLWTLPPLLAVWINFHGGVLAGVGILGVWGIAKVISILANRDQGSIIRRLTVPVAVGVCCGLALLLNPYGARLPIFLLETAAVPRPDIVEWQPLRLLSVPGAIYSAIVAFSIITMARSTEPRNPALAAVFVAVCVLPLTAVRHLQLFGIAVPLLLADDFASVWRRTTEPPQAKPGERALVIAVTGLAGVLLIGTGLRESRCIEIDTGRSIGFPVRAVDWLRASGVRANVATYFDWGEYVLWHLSPNVRISMDGRRETVYPDSIHQEYLRFQSGLAGWRGLLDREQTDLVLFPNWWPAYQLVDLDPGWDRVYDDSLGAVFARAGSRLAERLRATPIPSTPVDGHGQCVP